jgi:hypothetical protein
MNGMPWWVWLVPLGRPALTIAFVLLVGICQGLMGDKWPTFDEWASAFSRSCRYGHADGSPGSPRPGRPHRQQ